MRKSASAAAAEPIDIDLSIERAEISRRQKFFGAMVSLLGVTLDSLATRASYGARNRDMSEMEQAARPKIAGVLAGSAVVSQREWRFLIELLSGELRAVLRDEMETMPSAPGGLASIFNREEKKQKERRALVLRCCLELSGQTLQALADRATRASTEFSGTEAENAAAGSIEGKTTLSPGQWQILSRVFIAAALQALDREEQSIASERLDPEPGKRAEHDARLIAACMQIGDVSTNQMLQRVGYIAKSFGIESLSEKLEEKLRGILAAHCVMSATERAALLRVVIQPAAAALEAELDSGQESTAPADRFAAMISGCLKLLDVSIDDVAPAVCRLAGRWFIGRLETDAKGLLRKFLEDPAAVDFTTEERRTIANSIFPVPLKKLRAESEVAR